MIQIKKSVIVNHTPEKMFNLVKNIENYPKYLPWCTKSEVIRHNDNEVTGAVYLEYLMVKTHFVTRNVYHPYSKIDMYFVDGPFKELNGGWIFTPLGEFGCKIDFNLEYKFSNHFFEKIIGPVFSYISKNIVDCFIKEANKQYGSSPN